MTRSDTAKAAPLVSGGLSVVLQVPSMALIMSPTRFHLQVLQGLQQTFLTVFSPETVAVALRVRQVLRLLGLFQTTFLENAAASLQNAWLAGSLVPTAGSESLGVC